MSGPATWLGVAALGGIGALARFAIDSALSRRASTSFPVGTFAVNMTGSFLLGLATAATIGSTTLFLVGTGLLGSYTTYSTWIFESGQLAGDGEDVLALANLIVGAVAGVGLALAGWELGGSL